jgi:hypothetical protein
METFGRSDGAWGEECRPASAEELTGWWESRLR